MDSNRTSVVNSTTLSLDSEENEEFWTKLLNKLTIDKLDELHDKCFESFQTTDEFGITYEHYHIKRDAFLDAIDQMFGKGKFSYQALCLFNEIVGEENQMTWDQLLNFILEHTGDEGPKIELDLDRILTFDETKKQTIVKIVSIETANAFCYVVITKHGQVGIYDAEWRLLWSYIAILDEISAKGFYSAKRRHIKWITDALYMSDAEILVISTSARCLIFYDTSRLHHTPIWFVSGIRNVPQVMIYHCEINKSILFFGDEYGNVFKLTWLQPRIALLPRKVKDRLSFYYWRELYTESEYVIVAMPQKVHQEKICNIGYIPRNETLITCSETSKKSLILTDLAGCMDSYIFNIHRGVFCYFLDLEKEIILTGGNDQIVRVWNRFVATKPMQLLRGHKSKIVDVCINAAHNLIISLSYDGDVKLWHLLEYQCLQTLRLTFPSFSVLGKVVEWGASRSIYPGPCLKQNTSAPKSGLEDNCDKEILSEQNEISFCPSLNLHLSKVEEVESVVEVGEERDDEWSRDNFVITCCNHIAILKLQTAATKLEAYKFYSAPHSYKDEVVPKSWREILSKQSQPKKQITDLEILEELGGVFDYESKFRKKYELIDIMDKNLIKTKCTIHQRMLKLERLKEEMKPRVQLCAPYTALKLYDIAEMKLSDTIPISRTKQHRRQAERATKLIAACNLAAPGPIITDRSTYRSSLSSQSGNKKIV